MAQIVIKKGALKGGAPKHAVVHKQLKNPMMRPVQAASSSMPAAVAAPAKPAVKKAAPPSKTLSLDMALDRAIEAEKLKDYFISSVGRDLRRGIDSIAEIAQWLRDGTEDEQAYLQALDSLISYSVDLRVMLDDLEAVAKLDPNNYDSGLEPTDCAAQISSVAESFRAEAQAKGVSLAVRMSEIPCVEIDVHRLRQLVKLLVENAVKFTTYGRIGVEASFFADRLKIVVEDTGCGLPPEAQQEFAEADLRKAMPGEAGMALTVVKRLAFSLGGDISLRSTPGIGTVFTVTIANLRAVAGSHAESAMSAMQRISAISGSVGARMSRGAKVLLVDDSSVNLAVVNGLLKSMGFTNIETARNGSEALVKLLTEPYDVVLTDVRMPEMDGRVLVQEIRKLPAYEKMLVYAITVDDEAKDNYKELGFTDVLLKPVTKEKLQSILG